MLIPSTKVVFEGLSREYYPRQNELAASKFNGYVRMAFADFEGVVFYRDGKPVTALEESGTWMALGEELIAPLENKAAVTDGVMAVCELPAATIDFFAGRKVADTVETESGPMLGLRTLIDNLLRDRDVCIFRAKGAAWVGYVFIGAGRVIGASYASDRETLDGARAINALRQASGKAAVAIYFLAGGAPFVEVPPSVEMPFAKAAEAAAPVEVLRPPVSGQAPAEPVIVAPAPVQAPAPEPAPAPAEAEPAVPEVELKVVAGQDEALRLRHPSKLMTLETLEDRSVVWVDGVTLKKLDVRDTGNASLILPGGKTEQVTLLRMELLSGQGKYAIVPRKLRRRLSLVPGTFVTLKPGSALVPVR
ncbi:MAG: hypothetical protein A4E28_02274 [Methanocella sp. PtaU1.Bin125]|nr:MAG: hypothetical protein A4E28_02274 [Methanocella sp. PtaU1.Bin125]